MVNQRIAFPVSFLRSTKQAHLSAAASADDYPVLVRRVSELYLHVGSNDLFYLSSASF